MITAPGDNNPSDATASVPLLLSVTLSGRRLTPSFSITNISLKMSTALPYWASAYSLALRCQIDRAEVQDCGLISERVSVDAFSDFPGLYLLCNIPSFVFMCFYALHAELSSHRVREIRDRQADT